MTDLAKVAETARLIHDDCRADAEDVDKTPFTPKGVGTIFGELLAMIAGLAKCVEALAEERA
jgi:hypothetical protein